jgi:adenine-specific DNA methylase
VAPGGKTVVDLEDEGFKQNTIYKIKDNLNRRISNLSIEVDASGVWKLVPI